MFLLAHLTYTSFLLVECRTRFLSIPFLSNFSSRSHPIASLCLRPPTFSLHKLDCVSAFLLQFPRWKATGWSTCQSLLPTMTSISLHLLFLWWNLVTYSIRFIPGHPCRNDFITLHYMPFFSVWMPRLRFSMQSYVPIYRWWVGILATPSAMCPAIDILSPLATSIIFKFEVNAKLESAFGVWQAFSQGSTCWCFVGLWWCSCWC